MTFSSLTIAARYCGPTTSGNGGYVAGRLAGALGGASTVTLRSPPPLDRPLTWRDTQLYDGDTLIATAEAAEGFSLDTPAPVGAELAARCSRDYVGFRQHPFPRCFVCGPSRAEGDGLCIFPGRVSAETSMVAAPWYAHPAFGDAQGKVPSEVLWASLDCPGYFALGISAPALLGRMTARIDRTLSAGERCVVMGWPLAREGRKLFAGTALWNGQGELVGVSQQTWFLPAIPEPARNDP